MPHKIKRSAKLLTEVEIRKYKESDRAVLTDLLEALKDHIVSLDPRKLEVRKEGYGTAGVRWTLKEVSEKKGAIYLAETKDKKIIGYVTAIVLPEMETSKLGTKSGVKTGEVVDLYIDLSYRGNNNGTKLMSIAETYLKEQGCTHVEVGVFWPNVRAREFYEKAGYETENVTYIKEI